MHNNPKISIIVPVYNAEKYLHRCIDSILNQTFTDFELLLINDGSTDSSGDICDEYRMLDYRVRVFHKENGGVSSARNIGVKNMIGDYSIHCDSDDWIEENMLEKMYGYAKQNSCDVVLCDFYEYKKDNTSFIRYQKPVSLSQEQLLIDILTCKLHGSTWNKLIKTSLIKEKKVSFNEKISHSEDTLFNIQILLKNAGLKIGYLSSPLYNYCYNKNSITKNINSEIAFSFIEYVQVLSKISENVNTKLKKAFMMHFVFVKTYLLHSKVFSFSFIRSFLSESNKYLKFVRMRVSMKLLLFSIYNRIYPLTYILYLGFIINKKIKKNI